ncbi:hypothetical protein D3C87_1061840 [compost metagenome]|jgi:hypothetical protein
MASPAAVSASPRPDLRNNGVPACSSSFLICALMADVERPTRSAARAKLPNSIPASRLRKAATSKFVRDIDHPVLSNDSRNIF